MSSRRPGEAVLGLVLLGVLVGLAFIGHDHWRIGLDLIGATLLGAAPLRLLLPPSRIGLLAVRGRRLDAAVLAALGVAILALVGTYQVPR